MSNFFMIEEAAPKQKTHIARQHQIKDSYVVYTLWKDGRFTRHLTVKQGNCHRDSESSALEVLKTGVFLPKHDPKTWDWTGFDMFLTLIAEHEYHTSLSMARAAGWLPKPPVQSRPKTYSKHFDPKAERKLDGTLK